MGKKSRRRRSKGSPNVGSPNTLSLTIHHGRRSSANTALRSSIDCHPNKSTFGLDENIDPNTLKTPQQRVVGNFGAKDTTTPFSFGSDSITPLSMGSIYSPPTLTQPTLPAQPTTRESSPPQPSTLDESDDDGLNSILGPRRKPEIQLSKMESSIPPLSSLAAKLEERMARRKEDMVQKYHAQTQQVVIQQSDRVIDTQIQQSGKIMDTQIKQSDRILSGIDFSARKQEKKLSEMENNIVAKFEAKLETQCKELQKRFDYSMQQASNSSNSGVPGAVVSIGGQSLEAEQPSLLSENDRTSQPSSSLPEAMFLRKQLDDATTDKQALEAENKSLIEQIQAMQSKRRISRNVMEKQRRAEEQSIALKVKGRQQKTAALESSKLPTPYKSKLRSRSNK